MQDLSKKFCLAPFRKFETLIDGTVAPCCSIWIDERLGNLDHQTFPQIWNSDKAMQIRESIHDGSFRYCKKDRCTFLIHDTLPDRDSITEPRYRKIIDEKTTKMEQGPDWLFLAHDVTCNLACPSCRSGILKADDVQQKRLDTILENVLTPALSTGEPTELSICGQGDAWASKHYLSILRLLADNDLNVKLNLHTNGLRMTPERWAEYSSLEKYRPLVDVSIDACRPWTYEVVRRPGDWNKLLPNLQFIGRLRREGKVSQYFINATIQLDNFHEMADMVRLGKDLGCDGVRFYLIQNTGTHILPMYDKANVASPNHALHGAFLETLCDPTFDDPICTLYDVQLVRDRALQNPILADLKARVKDEKSCVELLGELVAENRLSDAAVITAYARHAFPGSIDLNFLDGTILNKLGFPLQASYRYKEALERDSSYPLARVPLGAVLCELGRSEEGVRCMIDACLHSPAETEVHDIVAKFLSGQMQKVS
jgi:MoaA/NifB/PqqE/SkfB family radical SAM enzyme